MRLQKEEILMRKRRIQPQQEEDKALKARKKTKDTREKSPVYDVYTPTTSGLDVHPKRSRKTPSPSPQYGRRPSSSPSSHRSEESEKKVEKKRRKKKPSNSSPSQSSSKTRSSSSLDSNPSNGCKRKDKESPPEGRKCARANSLLCEHANNANLIVGLGTHRHFAVPPMMQVVEVQGPDGKAYRFAAGTKAGFAVERINAKLRNPSTLLLFLEATCPGEEPVEFGPDAELAVLDDGWTLRGVTPQKAEHMEHLRAVFEMLRKKRLVVNEKKSEFFMEEIHFLGHIVFKDGVRMDPAKIKAIQDWPEPVNLPKVRSFLELCSYYRRFICFFAEIAAPLHDVTRKGVVFRFGERQQQAFKLLKEKLTTEPVLILPDLRKSFQVQCDACGSNIGAVLMQDGHVIAYESRV
ncbi:hypothetical protein L7F22_034870 [Adiantum nelumboides]|nr:hypothetical protein [Adiantum nelumboides]